MSETVHITLPWPPTLNHYRTVINRRLYTSKKGKAYRTAATAAILTQGNPQITGPVSVTERFYPARNMRYDLDNFRKAPRDVLVSAGVIEDDALIVEDHGYKCDVDRTNPRVEIEIRPMGSGRVKQVRVKPPRVIQGIKQ